MSELRSVSVFTRGSLVWVNANHQPSIKLHTLFGNKLYEVEGQGVSGCNASEGIEHQNPTATCYTRRNNSPFYKEGVVIIKSHIGVIVPIFSTGKFFIIQL